MAYASGNPKTKKQLKEWIAAGRRVEVFGPGMYPAKQNGREYLEGPHYPEPHKWYAQCEVKDGIIVSVK